jgi:hypothetical protein
MQVRSKVVEFSGHKFQVRKLLPDTGSFIFMRMLGISMRMSAETKSEENVPKLEPNKKPEKVSGEMRVRALSFSVFSGGISFEDFKFIQAQCMKSVAIIDVREGMDFPMPVVADDGTWTPEGLVVMDDVGLVTRLTTEVLVLCFADFFEESSPGL